jgi:hypothetical protein
MQDYAKHWRLSNEILLEQLEGVKSKMLVKYEDVVASPQSFVNELCILLNVEKITIDLPSIQIHDYPSGVRDYNQEAISRLTIEDKVIFNKEASSMMDKLRYRKLDVI